MTPAYRCGHPRTAENTSTGKNPRCKTCRRERIAIPVSPSSITSDPLFFGRAVKVAVEATGWSKGSILSNSRLPEVVRARYAVMIAMRERGVSFPRIGARLKRDHSTVMHGIRTGTRLAQVDAEFARVLEQVRAA